MAATTGEHIAWAILAVEVVLIAVFSYQRFVLGREPGL